MTKETELAWAAGFFDGEGCTSLAYKKTRKNQNPRLQIHIAQNTIEQLERFTAAVNGGVIYGPYKEKRNPNRSSFYQYTATGYNAVESILSKIWPYLCSDKKKQAAEMIRTYKEYYKDEDLAARFGDRTEQSICLGPI